jgi:hypothetical protein
MDTPKRILCFIDSFSIFKRFVVISGWAFCPGSSITEMLLNFPGGRVYLLSPPDLSSPDVAVAHGSVASRCRFDAQLLVSEPHRDMLNAELIIRASNGDSHVIKALSHQRQLSDPTNAVRGKFLVELSKIRPHGRFLEIGSRARSGVVRRDIVPESWSYTGVDVMAGDNVDVVGDAHKLSKLFPNERFDAVTAFSVLEHMLMPWKFVVELNRVLNVGAIGFFTTHQSWPIHDAPWDFWRFSDKSWSALFNQATGFEIIATAMGEPAYSVALFCHAATNFGDQHSFLSSVVYFRKISDTKLEWPVEVEEIIDSRYPPGQLPMQPNKATPTAQLFSESSN